MLLEKQALDLSFTNPELSDVQRAALERIHFFRNKLIEEFGIYVRTAGELEFYVEKKDRAGTPLIHSVQLLSLESLLKPAIQGLETVGYESVNDLGLPKDSAKYEITNIDPALTKQEYGALNPAVVAENIHKLQTGVLEQALNYTSPHTSTCLSSNVRPVFRARPFPNYVPTLRNIGYEESTVGLHINISPCLADGTNIFETNPALMYHYAKDLADLQIEAAVLAFPDSHSLLRMGAHEHVPRGIGVVENGKVEKGSLTSVNIRSDRKEDKTEGGSNRVENRLPGADADPYVNMATSVAALYNTVSKHVTKTSEGLAIAPFTINTIASEVLVDENTDLVAKHTSLVERLKHSKRARELLGNQLVDHYAPYRPSFAR